MKSYIYKSLSAIALTCSLGMATSCVGDLDQEPKDPNVTTSATFGEAEIRQALAKCYSVLGVSGQSGPGSSDISGLDNGTGQYIRAIAMMNEYPTDELMWIYADDGVVDLVTGTWGKDNVNIFGTYSRLYVHIAICNDFIRLIDNGAAGDAADLAQYRLEARALRALSYYWVVDLFGKGGFVDENTVTPQQWSRVDLYNWLAAELEDIVANYSTATPVYGRVGIDGVQALLARLYLNAKVYTDGAVNGATKCQEHCEAIINRHKGAGLNGSGLVEHYMYLFCGDNHVYLPGGGDVNEVLWGVPLDSDEAQSYGATTFYTAAATSNLTMADDGAYMNQLDYGMGAQWGCMHARKEFSDKFEDADKRWAMWKKEDDGFTRDNSKFSSFTSGYGVVKYTNLLKGTNGDWSVQNGGAFDPEGKIAARSEAFSDADYPMFRLAEVYLMYAECNIVDNAGDASKALTYVNYVRERAGVAKWTPAEMTADNILNERCREMYWENVRRSDLVRHNKFTGNNYVWSWKNNILKGGAIGEHMNIFPVPSNVIAAQPEFTQNPGY